MVCRTMTVSSGETDKTRDKMRVESFTGQSLGYTRDVPYHQRCVRWSGGGSNTIELSV